MAEKEFNKYGTINNLANALNRLAATQPGTLHCLLVANMQQLLEALESGLREEDKKNEAKLDEMLKMLNERGGNADA